MRCGAACARCCPPWGRSRRMFAPASPPSSRRRAELEGGAPMPSPSALVCLRCGALDQYASDCAACWAAQAPANLTLLFATAPGRRRSASAKCGSTRLARCEALWAEPASVAPLAAIERLRQLDVASSSDRVKGTSAVGKHLRSPPTVSEGLDDLLRTLRQILRVQPG